MEGINANAAIEAARRFLTGNVEGRDAGFTPLVPEFCIEARKIQEAMPLRDSIGGQLQSKYHNLNIPRSKILEARCTREWAKQLVEQGVHPRRSIWIPGPIGDRPEIGDLYGPDEDWKHGQPIWVTDEHGNKVPPKPLPGHKPPFMRQQEDMRRRFAGRPVLHRDVTLDRFRKLSAAQVLPKGATWSAALGNIYGPHPEGLTPDDVDAKRRSNPVYDAFVADYEEQKGKEPQQTPGDFMSKYGLTKEQFDAMPDVETPTAQAMRYTP